MLTILAIIGRSRPTEGNMQNSAKRAFAALLFAGGLGLSGCTYVGDGYGYGYDDYGYGYDNYGYGYDNYGYGYGSAGYYSGWYDNWYYPGYGIYIYDNGGRKRKWDDNHRRHWEGRKRDGDRGGNRNNNTWNGKPRDGVRDGDRDATRQGTWNGQRRDGNGEGRRNGQWTGGQRGTGVAAPQATTPTPQNRPQRSWNGGQGNGQRAVAPQQRQRPEGGTYTPRQQATPRAERAPQAQSVPQRVERAPRAERPSPPPQGRGEGRRRQED